MSAETDEGGITGTAEIRRLDRFNVPVLQVQGAITDEPSITTAMVRIAAERARADNRDLVSGDMLIGDVIEAFEALEQQGFTVIRNPQAIEDTFESGERILRVPEGDIVFHVPLGATPRQVDDLAAAVAEEPEVVVAGLGTETPLPSDDTVPEDAVVTVADTFQGSPQDYLTAVAAESTQGSPQDYLTAVAAESTDPEEISLAYLEAQQLGTRPPDPVEEAVFGILQAGQRIDRASFAERAEVEGISGQYFKRGGLSLDEFLEKVNEQVPGFEVERDDVVRVVESFPRGPKQFREERESPEMRMLAQRFKDVTGQNIQRVVEDRPTLDLEAFALAPEEDPFAVPPQPPTTEEVTSAKREGLPRGPQAQEAPDVVEQQEVIDATQPPAPETDRPQAPLRKRTPEEVAGEFAPLTGPLPDVPGELEQMTRPQLVAIAERLDMPISRKQTKDQVRKIIQANWPREQQKRETFQQLRETLETSRQRAEEEDADRAAQLLAGQEASRAVRDFVARLEAVNKPKLAHAMRLGIEDDLRNNRPLNLDFRRQIVEREERRFANRQGQGVPYLAREVTSEEVLDYVRRSFKKGDRSEALVGDYRWMVEATRDARQALLNYLAAQGIRAEDAVRPTEPGHEAIQLNPNAALARIAGDIWNLERGRHNATQERIDSRIEQFRRSLADIQQLTGETIEGAHEQTTGEFISQRRVEIAAEQEIEQAKRDAEDLFRSLEVDPPPEATATQLPATPTAIEQGVVDSMVLWATHPQPTIPAQEVAGRALQQLGVDQRHLIDESGRHTNPEYREQQLQAWAREHQAAFEAAGFAPKPPVSRETQELFEQARAETAPPSAPTPAAPTPPADQPAPGELFTPTAPVAHHEVGAVALDTDTGKRVEVLEMVGPTMARVRYVDRTTKTLEQRITRSRLAEAPPFREDQNVYWYRPDGSRGEGVVRFADEDGVVVMTHAHLAHADRPNGVPLETITNMASIGYLTPQLPPTAPVFVPEQPPTTSETYSARVSVLAERLDMGNRGALGPITAKELHGLAAEVFGGTMAEGAYTPKDAYEAVELAANRHMRDNANLYDPRDQLPKDDPHTHAFHTITSIETMMENLPSQNTRTERQQEFQQFSTPPNLAYAMAWAANLSPNDQVLEPSAGIGGLAVYAHNVGADVVLNELDDKRAHVLQRLDIGEVHRLDAYSLSALLPAGVEPDVVLMNPPFSATGGRKIGKKDFGTGAEHLVQALKSLRENGRLVAILPGGRDTGSGMSMNAPKYRGFWNMIAEHYDIRANIGVDGSVYSQYGTAFNTRVVVIDNTGPTLKTTQGLGGIVEGEVDSIEALLELLEPVRNARTPSAQRAPAEPAGQGPSQPGPGPGPGSRPTLPSATGGLRNRSPRHPATSGAEAGPPTPPRRATPEAGRGDAGPVDDGGRRRGQPGPDRPGQPTPERDVVDQPPGQPPSGVRAGLRLTQTTPQERQQATIEAVGQPAGIPLTSSVFEQYEPQATIEGAQPHPGNLVESAAMAAVTSPRATYIPTLDPQIVADGRLSDAQLEAIIYAGQAHQAHLPERLIRPTDALSTEEGRRVTYRKGYFIGDGTGVGKGREISGVILDNWNQGRRRHIWISEKADLMKDAVRDMIAVAAPEAAVGPLDSAKEIRDAVARLKEATGIDIRLLNDFSEAIPEDFDGIIFLSYDTLRGRLRKAGFTRVEQLVNWAGPAFDGVIALDESHNLGNAIETKAARGTKKASQKALAGVELQDKLADGRVLYVSATGATEPMNLAYAERLGLWGPDTAFADKFDFIEAITNGGVAAMEMIAGNLKALGLYTARSLSYQAVEYDTLVHTPTDDQVEQYNIMARAWQVVLQNIDKALEMNRAEKNPAAKSAALSTFWGAQQRFFNQVLTSLSVPTLIQDIEAELDAGRSVVLQLVNTMEAATERQVAQALANEEALEDLDITPREILIQFLQTSFPVALNEEYTDENNNVRYRPVVKPDGDIAENPEAVVLREQMIEDVASLAVPAGVLDEIINHFGTERVAEVTGRRRRFVREEGAVVQQRRGRTANLADIEAFQAGRKKILIFSDAGGTGRSFHADNTAENKDRRAHFLVQPGWRADKAMQGFGRTHRTNQASAPVYKLVTTTLKAQRRFLSSIARRLDQLGALTRGQRQTTSQGMFSAEFNLENEYSRFAITNLFMDAYRGDIPEFQEAGLSFDQLQQQLGLNLIDKESGGLNVSKIPSVPQFLNRLLSLETTVMDLIFDVFSEKLNHQVEAAREAGTYDEGIENLTAEGITKIREDVVFTDQDSGAETRVVQLDVTQRIVRTSWSQIESHRFLEKRTLNPDRFDNFVQQKNSGQVYALYKAGSRTNKKTGRVVNEWRRVGVRGVSFIDETDIWKYKVLTKDQARRLWDEEHNQAPKTKTDREVLVTGALLPVWDRLPTSAPQIRRVQTDDGERFIGRLIPQQSVGGVLQRLGAEQASVEMTPEAAANAVLKEGKVLELANGWKFKRARRQGEQRIEVTNVERKDKETITQAGGFTEIINHKLRFFVPTANAAPVIETLTRRRPIVNVMTGTTGASGYASVGNYRSFAPPPLAKDTGVPDRPLEFLDRSGAAVPIQMGGLSHVRPLAMPELARMVREVGADVRISRRLHKSNGLFSPVGRGTIKIRPDLFRDPHQAAATFAHEIGHLVDYLPDEALDRGNILGRIAGLRRFMATTLDPSGRGRELTPADRRRLRTEATKRNLNLYGHTLAEMINNQLVRLKLKQPIADEYRMLLDLEINHRGLLSEPAIREELWSLSTWWRPMPANPEASYLRYRRQAAELYADAISVLLNAPAELERRAPTFYQAFFTALQGNPEVAASYEELQLVLAGGPEAVGKSRDEALRNMIGDEAETRKTELIEQQKARRQSFKDRIAQQLVTRWHPIITRIKRAEKQGQYTRTEDDPRYLLEEISMRDGPLAAIIAEVGEKVIAPVEAQGMTIEDLGAWMFLNRVAHEKVIKEAEQGLSEEALHALADMQGDDADAILQDEIEQYRDQVEVYGRAVQANPLGFTEQTALEHLDYMEESLGLGKLLILQEAGKQFSDIILPVLQEAAEVGRYSREFVDTVAIPNRYNYATFRVLDYMQHADYVGAGVAESVGTFRSIDNPLTATLLKTLSLKRANIVNRGKRATVGFLEERFPADIKKAKRSSAREFETPPAGRAALSVFEDGQLVQYHTDPYIVKAFDFSHPGVLDWVSNVMRWFNKPFRAGFITYNLSFGLWFNPIRDTGRLLKTLNYKGQRRVIRREVVSKYFKNRRSAWAYARGNLNDPKALQMVSEFAIVPPGEAMMFEGRNDGLSRIAARYGLATMPRGDRYPRMVKLIETVEKLTSGVRLVGRYFEALPKFAAFDMLTERGITGRERAHAVRTRAGTPNFTDGGTATYLTNQLFMFSNIFVQGWRSDIAVATDPRTRGGYWFRTLVIDLIPKLIMRMAAVGAPIMAMLVGDDLAEWLEEFYSFVGEYDKRNYMIIPLGYEEGDQYDYGKRAVYLRIPHDETGRVLAQILWDMTDTKTNSLRKLFGTLDTGADTVPGVAPPVDIAAKWGIYLSGSNPKDYWYGREIIPRRAQTARAAGDEGPAFVDMLKWTVDQQGFMRLSWRPKATTYEQLPFLNRILKVSDYGKREAIRKEQELEQAERASIRLGYGDDVDTMYREYYRLRSIGTANLNDRQVEEWGLLKGWHNQVYRPYDEMVFDAHREGDQDLRSEATRELQESTAMYLDELQAMQE